MNDSYIVSAMFDNKLKLCERSHKTQMEQQSNTRMLTSVFLVNPNKITIFAQTVLNMMYYNKINSLTLSRRIHYHIST